MSNIPTPSCFPVYVQNNELLKNPDFLRAGHSMDFYDNSIYTYGGYNAEQDLYVLRNASKLVEDESQTYWEKHIIEKVHGRSAHTTFLLDHLLYVYAGYDDNEQIFSDIIEIDLKNDFNVRTLKYSKVCANVERRWHGSVFKDNKLFVHGGWNKNGALGDLIVLQWDTLQWSKIETQGIAPSPRRWHSFTQLSENSNQFLVYGGYNGDDKVQLADFYILDLEKQVWIQPTMKGDPGMRCRHSLTPIGDKQFLLMGGYSGTHKINRDLFIFHSDDNSWQFIEKSGALYPVIRSAHKVTKVNEYGFVVGGGIVKDYVEPFFYFDSRMIKLMQ